MNARQEVYEFAEAMERVLKRNDHKGGWDRDTLPWLFAKFIEEVGEVGKGFVDQVWTAPEAPFNKEDLQALCDELVDVANMAMMLRDRLIKIKDV